MGLECKTWGYESWVCFHIVQLQVMDGGKRTRKVGSRDMVDVNYIPVSFWNVKVRHANGTTSQLFLVD